jgi:hypothetical protein
VTDNRDRDERGQFPEQYTDQQFLTAVTGLDQPTTQDVADSVGCSRQLAHLRLRQLEDDNEVASRKIGNANVWTLPD